jgi:hypothetical protein
MVLDTRYSLIGGPMRSAEPGLYHDGERIDYRWGEPNGDAVKRHLAKKAEPAAKPITKPAPAVDPRVTELRRMEAQLAQSKRELALKELKEEHDKAKAERDSLRSQLAAKSSPKSRGMASKLKFGQSFRIGKPNGTAA